MDHPLAQPSKSDFCEIVEVAGGGSKGGLQKRKAIMELWKFLKFLLSAPLPSLEMCRYIICCQTERSSDLQGLAKAKLVRFKDYLTALILQLSADTQRYILLNQFSYGSILT